MQFLEESTQHANRSELYFGFIKKGIRKDTQGKNAPAVLWYYAAERRAQILTIIAMTIFKMQVYNLHTDIISEMGDISNLY